MKTDIHDHVLPESVVRFLEREPDYGVEVRSRTWFAEGVEYELADFVDPAVRLERLAKVGLEAAVVSTATQLFFYDLEAAPAEQLCRAVNEGLAEFCGHDPDRLRWMAHLPLQAPEAAGRVLADAVDAGCVGIFIATSVAGQPLDDAGLDGLWAEAERLRLPVFVHPSFNDPHPGMAAFYLQNAIGNLLETTIAVERLICAGVLDRHPGLVFVLAHGGGYYPLQGGRLRHARTVRPELVEAPADPFAYRGQIKTDCLTHDPDTLRFVVERMGAENVLMGTDTPYDMATPEPVVDLVDAVGAANARLIAEENPARLYGFTTGSLVR